MFLPPGHTHIGIDRGFSRVSTAIKCEDVQTVEGQLKAIKSQYFVPNFFITLEFLSRLRFSQKNPVPTVEWIPSIADFRTWLNDASSTLLPLDVSLCP